MKPQANFTINETDKAVITLEPTELRLINGGARVVNEPTETNSFCFNKVIWALTPNESALRDGVSI